MCSSDLEPSTRDANAGVLFMHNEGWSTMCGHGIIAVTTMAIERGLIWPGGTRESGHRPTAVDIRYDTPAGLVQARAHLEHHGESVRVSSVAFRNVASFVFEPSIMVPVGGRKIPVDVAFGGAFYAIVDAEAAFGWLGKELLAKAKNLRGMAQALIEHHGGELPRTVDELTKLPGVGRKTANVLLGTAFGLATGVVVDTHVRRITRLLGLTRQQDPVKIERDLEIGRAHV